MLLVLRWRRGAGCGDGMVVVVIDGSVDAVEREGGGVEFNGVE